MCTLYILWAKQVLPHDVLTKYDQCQAEDAILQAKITRLVSLSFLAKDFIFVYYHCPK